MEGAIFYWFAWIGWVWATFLVHKESSLRWSFSLGVLVLMTLSPYRIEVFGIEMYLSVMVLLAFFIVSTAKLGLRDFLSVFLAAFIIMIGYVSFLLFELFDPVWVMFDRKWIIAVGGILLSSILQADLHLRIYSLVAGMVLGEFLFSFLLKRLSILYPVGNFAFLDMLALMVMIIAVWTGFSLITQSIGNVINYGRGNQKTS